jgi:hypothetical protein
MKRALAALLVSGAAMAWAHVVEPRADLDGFVRRAECIVRGRVLSDTRPLHPGQGAYPLQNEVAIERIWKGPGEVSAVTVLGRDEHAPRYIAGQQVILFLFGRPGVDRYCWADQNQGEEILVGPGEHGAWDAYLEAVVRALAEAQDLARSPGYQAAVRAALVAPAPRLRAHAREAIRRWLQGAAASAEDREALLGALGSRTLPVSDRLAVLKLALAHLAPSDLAPLAKRPDEGPRMRSVLLEAWASVVRERGSPAEGEEVRVLARSLLGEPQPLGVSAMVALARLGEVAASSGPGETLVVTTSRGGEAGGARKPGTASSGGGGWPGWGIVGGVLFLLAGALGLLHWRRRSGRGGSATSGRGGGEQGSSPG